MNRFFKTGDGGKPVKPCDSESFTIYKQSAHGLGHLLDIDEKQWWKDILALHYFPKQEDEILKKYEKQFAMTQLTVSTPDVWKRLDKLNKNRRFEDKIKSFNFVLVGVGFEADPDSQDKIIPVVPYHPMESGDKVPYEPFVDYKSGKVFGNNETIDTSYYWKRLSSVMLNYINHKESKSAGNQGFLERRILSIDKNSIRYTGKESNNLELDLMGLLQNNNVNYIDFKQLILSATKKQWLEAGLSLNQRSNLIKQIRENKPLNLKQKTFEKIVKLLENSAA